MPSAKTVWGIDVGQCALKALKLQWRDGKLRALGFDVIEHAKILSQPDADEQALIRSALGKFLGRNSIKGSTLVISVPGQASFTRFIKLPPVEMKKIPEIVRYEARQQIPFNLEDVVWDYQTISAPSAGPREVEVGIFAMKRDIVADYVSDFLAMKIEPDVVQMAPVALYNYLRYDKQEGGGATVLIDVGAENTNFVIADGERVWIRNIPLGGNNFTQALAKEFKLPFAKAENLKRHAAESKHARQVFQAMRPVFGDLLTEVQRSIGYYTSLHRDSRVERVVALGNAFRLAGLTKFLSQNLGVEVTKIEDISALAGAEALQAPLFRENVLSFGVTFGLAIQGLGVSAIQTSLLPPEILSSKILKRKRPFFVAAGVALLGAVGCFGYSQMASSGELAGKSGEVPRLKSEIDNLRKENDKQKGRFEEQKTALTAEAAKIDEIEGLLSGDTYMHEVYRTVWDAWPLDENLARYNPITNDPQYSTLSIIEMLNLTAHYVPDVRVYGEAAAAGAPADPAAGQSTDAGQPGQPAAKAAVATPGVLIEIEGVTPKTGRDGHEFVNNSLIAGLKRCRRTVEIPTPAGKDVLAKIPLTGVFRNQPAYTEFGKVYTPPKVVPTPGAPAAPATPEPPGADRGEDYWFKAQWVVEVGPLREEQRKEVFGELVRIAGQPDPREAVRKVIYRAKDVSPDLGAGVAQLARTWLISATELAQIAGEGATKEWAAKKDEAPAPPQ